MLCSSNKCGVCECDENEVPDAWEQTSRNNGSSPFNTRSYPVNTFLQPSDSKSINANGFSDDWMFNEELDKESLYINLLENSEAFTAYNGSHIWKAIYEENCFERGESASCHETRLLYKLVSGVHTNINMHISHYFSEPGQDEQYENLGMYYQRVGFSDERLRNMHFAYSFVLRAINREAEKLMSYKYSGIDEAETERTRALMHSFLDSSTRYCEEPFKERDFFQTISEQEFIAQVKPQFQNITRILDCVPCEKCRLHGKLQFTGLSAVMKIMFGEIQPYTLSRNEIVGLINLMAKLSNSLEWYQSILKREARSNTFKAGTRWAVSGFLFLAALIVLKRIRANQAAKAHDD